MRILSRYRRPALAVGLALVVAACGSSPSGGGGSRTRAPAATTTVPAGDGSSPTKPIPRGRAGSIGGWRVRVLGFRRLQSDDLGSHAPSGYAFMVYRLRTVRTGSDPQSPLLLTPHLLGPSNVERGAASSPLCFAGNSGLEEVHQGGRVTLIGCISVRESDVGHLVLGVSDIINSLWFATTR